MTEGKVSLALAYAERQSRYDLHDCRTRAEKDGDGYTALRPARCWVLNGHAADHVVVAARTDGADRDREGISLFVVDSDTPGLTRTLR